MAKHGKTGLERIWHAALFSLAGMRAAWQHEAAFRQELLLIALLALLLVWGWIVAPSVAG